MWFTEDNYGWFLQMTERQNSSNIYKKGGNKNGFGGKYKG